MRVLLDVNVYVSYLLPSRAGTAIARVLEAALTGTFVLLLPAEVTTELAARVASKPYLSERIERADLEELLEALRAVGEIIPPITTPIPRVSRDPKDDYLLAYALVGRADYLVTGGDDLLELGEVDGVRIVTPAGFRDVLGV